MKPYHLIYAVVLFALGAVALSRDGWVMFGVTLWILGAVTSVWVVVTGFWHERAEYLDSLSDVLHEVKDVDLDKMAALGISKIEPSRKVIVDLHEGTRSRHFDLPVSPVKLQPLARGLLSGRPFSERNWSELLSSSEFRALRATLKSKGLIVPVSEKDARQGYILTDTGQALMRDLLPSPIVGDE
jgi:hypothetical protein